MLREMSVSYFAWQRKPRMTYWLFLFPWHCFLCFLGHGRDWDCGCGWRWWRYWSIFALVTFSSLGIRGESQRKPSANFSNSKPAVWSLRCLWRCRKLSLESLGCNLIGRGFVHIFSTIACQEHGLQSGRNSRSTSLFEGSISHDC